MAAPALVVVFALAATAWFSIGVRQAEDTSQASTIVSSGAPISAAQASQASRLLDAAAFLNPDRVIDALRAQLEQDRGDLGAARTILKRLIKAEPDNLAAWLGLARASVHDLRDFYAAAFAIRHLAPAVPAPG